VLTKYVKVFNQLITAYLIQIVIRGNLAYKILLFHIKQGADLYIVMGYYVQKTIIVSLKAFVGFQMHLMLQVIHDDV